MNWLNKIRKKGYIDDLILKFTKTSILVVHVLENKNIMCDNITRRTSITSLMSFSENMQSSIIGLFVDRSLHIK